MNTSIYRTMEFFPRIEWVKNNMLGDCPVKVEFKNPFGDHHYTLNGVRDKALTAAQCEAMITTLEAFVPTNPLQQQGVQIIHTWLCQRKEWKPIQLAHIA